MNGLYLYGVVEAGKGLTLNVEGVAGSVRALAEGGLGAIVGAAPDRPLLELNREQTLRLLVKHQEALERTMVQTTVLPVKFGAMAPDEDAVRRMLARGAGLLRSRLDEFAGRLQYEIVVTWELERVFAEIAAEPDIAQARQAVQTMNGGAGKEAQLAFGQKVKAALERRRSEAAQKIREGLKAVALDIAANAVMDDRMVANFAVLLDRTGGEALDPALERLDAQFEGRLKFRCVGPLPPSSFATVEVVFPSRQSIEQARRTLNIEGPGDKQEIVSAFRKLARENHPDAAGSAEHGAERMGQLSGAYKLLMAHVKTRGDDDGDDDAPAVIIDVVRKESPNIGATT
jgi:hypothetical protein